VERFPPAPIFIPHPLKEVAEAPSGRGVVSYARLKCDCVERRMLKVYSERGEIIAPAGAGGQSQGKGKAKLSIGSWVAKGCRNHR